ncbi:RluA family pseudouridine synthase [Paenibacillus sp. TRM 82003]|nr:RluA family pseudouridine synthase [Paenibacillus sp. TRM 82003]
MIPSTDEVYELTVGPEEAGERIDKLLVEAMEEELSRSQLQDWIRDGHVLVNGRAVKPNYKLADGDEIAVSPPEPESTELVPQDIPLDVVYEDSDVIVVNKPRGMVVHPALGHPNGTLVNALMFHCKDLSGINGEIRPGIVHRIDKDTSGLLMAAKNDKAHASLSAQLKEHSVTRRYVAIVHGVLAHDQGTVDAPIGRDPQDRKLFTVTEKGAKHAVTHFAIMERFPEYTVLDLMLETGRTHQIRVHMKFIGHPLVGDPVYGRSKGRTMDVPGQALHAAALGFTHPRTGERLTFEAPIPDDMQTFIEQLRLM